MARRPTCSSGCLLTFLLLVVLPLGWAMWSNRLPSDASVVARFQRHRAALERLQVMLSEDEAVDSVGPLGTNFLPNYLPTSAQAPPKPNLAPARLQQYQKLIEGAELWSAFKMGRHQRRFPFDGFGFMGEGWRIAFVHSSRLLGPPEDTLVADVGQARKSRAPNRTAYRHLDGAWYVFVTW